MANSYNLAVDLSGVLAGIATIDTVVDAIRAVDVPALQAEHVLIDAVVDAIRATDVPTITAAIAAIPSPRGTLKREDQTSTASTYEEVINVTGSGKLLIVWMESDSANATIDFVQITIDGTAYEFGNGMTADTKYALLLPDFDTLATEILTEDSGTVVEEPRLLNFEFNTSLFIGVRRSTGSNNIGRVRFLYIED